MVRARRRARPAGRRPWAGRRAAARGRPTGAAAAARSRPPSRRSTGRGCSPKTLIPCSSRSRRCLAEVLSLAGKRDRAIEVGESLLAPARRRTGRGGQPGRGPSSPGSGRGGRDPVGRRVASALDAGPSRGGDGCRRERCWPGSTPSPPRPRWASTRPMSAVALATVGVGAAERLDLPEVACEALEILGRCERPRDLAAAEAAFARAYAIADAARPHGLAGAGAARAGHHRPAGRRRRDRLDEARAIGVRHGALATAAVLDVQIAAGLAVRDDPEQAVAVARRGADLARRYRLDQTLAAALAFEALVHARARRRDAMERCERDARAASGEIPQSRHDRRPSPGGARVRRGRPPKRCAATRVGRGDPVRRASATSRRDRPPACGRWSRSLDEHADAEQLPGRATSPSTSWPGAFSASPRPWWPVGRADGRRWRSSWPRATGSWPNGAWYRHLGHRLVAEATIADGWGEPVAWLREALAFFEAAGRRPDRVGVPVAAAEGGRAGAAPARGDGGRARRALRAARHHRPRARGPSPAGRGAVQPGDRPPACTCRPAPSNGTSPTSRSRPASSAGPSSSPSPPGRADPLI